jgi:hypothetical protein
MATHRPTISYPQIITSDELLTDRRGPITPVSPPKTPSPPRGHRHLPSISKPMTWLARTSSSDTNHHHKRNASTPTIHSPIQISEPKFANHASLLMLNPVRSGTLGSGATVVRTPQEALAGSGVQFGEEEVLEDIQEEGAQEQNAICSDDEDLYVQEHKSRELPSPPDSPPLPQVPSRNSVSNETSQSSPDLQLTKDADLPPSQTPPPSPSKATNSSSKECLVHDSKHPQSTPPPSVEVLRPSVKTISPQISDHAPYNTTPIQPPFHAILVSPVPSSTIDRSKIIISLETTTTTYRTTLATLTSRTSHLSEFLTSILPTSDPEDAKDAEDGSDNASVASQPPYELNNSFNSIFHNHLTAAGLLTQSSTSLHIFLDRPSAPLVYYLRVPSGPRLIYIADTCTFSTTSAPRLHHPVHSIIHCRASHLPPWKPFSKYAMKPNISVSKNSTNSVSMKFDHISNSIVRLQTCIA